MPTDLKAEAIDKLNKTRICGQRSEIAKLEDADALNKLAAAPARRRPSSNGSGDRRRPSNRDNNRGDRRPRAPRKDS